MRDLRFGFTSGSPRTAEEFADACRAAEAYGFDTVTVIDHLGPGRLSPFSALVAAAHVAPGLRGGTYVVNNGFWNASMLAREVSTAVRLTRGRVDLGLGIGLIKAEFDAAGIPFLGFSQRVAALEAAIAEIRELLAEEGQEMPPLLIGGSGERVLRLAAKHADIVSFAGLRQREDREPGNFWLSTAEEARGQVALVRDAAGERAETLRLDNFVKNVELTDDRRAVVTRMLTDEDYVMVRDVEEGLASPFLLVGTEEQIARQIIEDHDRYGFTSITVQRHYLDVLGPIIKRARALA